MQEVSLQIFVSYAHADRDFAREVRAIIDGIAPQVIRKLIDTSRLDPDFIGKAALTGAIAGAGGLVGGSAGLAAGIVGAGTAAGFAATGAATGAAAGSIIPGPGTLVGAALGAAGGFVFGVGIELMMSANRKLKYTRHVWMDEDIKPGDNWNEAVRVAITTCSAFVIVVPATVSPNVAAECGMALGFRKKVVPIARSAQDLQTYNLGAIHALDLPSSLTEEWTNRFVDTLLSIPTDA